MDMKHGTGKLDKHRTVRWSNLGTYCLIFLAGLLFGIVFARFILWPLILRCF